jgi:hypothetical protein
MTALQSIIKEAKSLKKQYPKRYSKWTDYVKQASAIYASKHKGKSPVGKKKATKKKVGAAKPLSKHKDTKSHNVNIRVVSGIKKKKAVKKIVKKSPILTKVKQVLKQGNKRLVHGYNLTSGKVRLGSIKMGNLPTYHDMAAAKEIQLFADNDYDLYRQQKRPILINLGKKYKKGTYKIELAAKLWKYYIDNAMKKYNKDFGSRGDKWYDLLDMHDRNLLAHEFAVETKNEFDLGNFTEQ